MWQPGREGSLGENGYMSMYGCVPAHLKLITTLLTGYTPIQNIKYKRKQCTKDLKRYFPKYKEKDHIHEKMFTFSHQRNPKLKP